MQMRYRLLSTEHASANIIQKKFVSPIFVEFFFNLRLCQNVALDFTRFNIRYIESRFCSKFFSSKTFQVSDMTHDIAN